MKLKFSLFLAILAGLVGWSSCKKGDDSVPCTVPDPAALRYTANMKAIIDEYCISCHSGSGPGPGNYTTYEGIESDLHNGKVMETVVIEKTMPQGFVMPQAKIDSINCWLQNGHPK
jgi:hypothetical protein